LFVFHTLKDAFGAVLTEAMAAGVLSVSSAWAAVTRDFIADGNNGFVIDPRRPEEAASTIARALAIPEEQKRVMIERAWRSVRKATFESESERMVRFAGSLVNRRRATHRGSGRCKG
jgi:glycosyltransferase involved in cell wall biosynthesis